jgi:arginine decarboxylase
MKIKYQDFIHQTYDFPQEEFDLKEGELQFHGVSLMELVRTYGTPFKFSYLPKISENIQRARQWFADAIKKTNYQGKYHYAYCTKSSHFKFVMEEVLKNEVLMETSYTTDLQIVEHMVGEGRFPKSGRVLCTVE